MRAWLIRACILLLLGGGLYTIYLDYSVRERFEGKRWALPARVYARPLELFNGMNLTPSQLESELKLLRYQRNTSASSVGSYRRSGDYFELHTRPFKFTDGEENSRFLRVRFAGGQIVAIHDSARGSQISLVRLDPLLIGSIYPRHKEDRILTRLDDVPSLLIQAMVAVEDRNFSQHWGVDPRAIARAAWANIKAAKLVQGGSTLTQQLVKNLYLSPERSLWRKAREAIMSVLLEVHYSKGEIFEAYINEIYLGQSGPRGIHGFGLASQFYFDQPLKSLAPHQIALLVAIVKGPSYYDPRRRPERARSRRNLVLKMLANFKLLSAKEADRYASKPLGVTAVPAGSTTYPAFMQLVLRQLIKEYREEDLRSEGLRIFTSFDPRVQSAAEAIVSNRVSRLDASSEKEKSPLQAAVVVTSRDSGEILALVGGKNPRFPGFNRALDAVRPIGSLIKPAVYLAALSPPAKYTLVSRLEDKPVRIAGPKGDVWQPANYDRVNHGNVSLETALVNSYNLSTVRLGMALGAPRVMEMLHRLGVDKKITPYPSLFLGATALTPLDVSQYYQTIAANGFYTPLKLIRAVLTTDNQPIQRYPLTLERTVDQRSVYLLNTALQKVVREGTAKRLKAYVSPQLQAAGKTGTTDDLRDSWFAGFTGDYVAVVWLGRDDNSSTGLTGASGAMRVWGEIMGEVARTPLELEIPEGVALAAIDRGTGLRVPDHCSGDVVEIPFIESTLPAVSSECPGGSENWLQNLFR